MQPKVKIVFSLTILIISIIISIAFYVDSRNFSSIRAFGHKEKAIILDKVDDYDIEPMSTPSRYVNPTRAKRINFHLVIRCIVAPSIKQKTIPDSLSYLKNEEIDLFIAKKEDWKKLQILDTIDIYTNNNHNNFYLAKDIICPPFWNRYYYVIALIGLALAIIVYRKL
ncbi:MAG: hypothetical protein IT271_12135 [Chitinophagales bacterium]|nr:hypothetical protein [Chitinophagales bacterium]